MDRGTPDTATVLGFLWRKIDKLNDDDLEWLSCSSGEASHTALTLGRVIDGLGCMVGDTETASATFEGGTAVASLLFNIASQVTAIGELAGIGADARAMLEAKRLSRGK